MSSDFILLVSLPENMEEISIFAYRGGGIDMGFWPKYLSLPTYPLEVSFFLYFPVIREFFQLTTPSLQIFSTQSSSENDRGPPKYVDSTRA